MNTVEPDPPEPSEEPPFVVKKDERVLLYTEAIRYLNTLRKNLLIYPSGHVQVENSLKNGVDSVIALFTSEEKQITMGVLKEEIIIDDEPFNSANPINREFAVYLKRHDIAAIVFFPDIEAEELGRFFEIVNRPGDEIEDSGGIEKVVSDSSFKNIQVKGADFSKLFLTRETEISQYHGTDEAVEGDFSWKSFIGNLLSGTLSADESCSDEKGDVPSDPSAVARLINEKSVDRTQALKHYRELLDSQLKKRAGKPDVASGAGMDDSLTLLLNGLNPEMRKQFLSTTLTSCSEADAGGSEVGPVLRGLGENLVTEMLHLANEKGDGISPSLLSFIGKISGTGTGGEETGGLTSPVIESHHNTSLSSVTNLFSREKRENAVASGYRDVLDNLSSRVKSLTPEEGGLFSIEEHLTTLEESSIDFQIARVLLSFIETNVSDSIYSDYSRQLMSGILKSDLMDRSKFLFLSDVLGAFRRHVKEKPDRKIRESARKALDTFNEQVFIARVVQAFDAKGAEFGEEASELLFQIGPSIVPEVLERYAGRKGGEDKQHLLKVLRTYRREALSEAKKHLHDLMPSFVSNIVVFIRETGGKEDVAVLKPLLQHNDLKIKTEAVSALLKFNNSWGVSSLRKMLISDRDEYQRTAIRLSGKFRVKEAVPDLISMVTRMPLLEGAFKKNEELVKSLGQIGDRAALPVFEKLANYRVPFSAESLSHMKVTVFESLSGFKFRDIEGFVEKGTRSPVYRIRQICSELKNRNRKRGGSEK